MPRRVAAEDIQPPDHPSFRETRAGMLAAVVLALQRETWVNVPTVELRPFMVGNARYLVVIAPIAVA